MNDYCLYVFRRYSTINNRLAGDGGYYLLAAVKTKLCDRSGCTLTCFISIEILLTYMRIVTRCERKSFAQQLTELVTSTRVTRKWFHRWLNDIQPRKIHHYRPPPFSKENLQLDRRFHHHHHHHDVPGEKKIYFPDIS